jgi:hypothetical protein
MKRLTGLIVLILAVAAGVVVTSRANTPPAPVAVAAVSSSTTTLEAAKHSATEAHGAIPEDEARLTADRKRAASADAVVAAIEAEAPAKEEPPAEPPTGATVNATPTGPAAPGSGWRVVYADGFGAALGTDGTWSLRSSGNFTNSRELQTFTAAEDYVTPQGLVERCTQATKTCGAVESKAFRFTPAEGETLAFEAVIRYPPNQHNEDFGWWSYGWGGGKESEFDFTESWGYTSENTLTSGYTKTRNGTCWLPTEVGEDKCASGIYSFDPSAGFHRYTTVIYPDNTFSQYIDGALTSWANHVPISEAPNKPAMRLILSYAMAGSGFTEPTSTLAVRSVAVYEDQGHAGQFISGGGVAPGTTVR